MMVESFGYMGEALFLAIVFVYLILAAQFESFIDPLAIMLSLPLAIVGMAGMLFITGDTISIMSLIGLIMLMGLVTKNAILLVDFTKVLRGRGMDRREALITAGRTRLRPIMMTTSAMIFGMLPLFFALGKGAEFRAPMARAVVGGLITSTLLTLIVVPVVYAILDDLAAWLHRRMAGAEFETHDAAKAAAALFVVTLAGSLFVAPALAQPSPTATPGPTLNEVRSGVGDGPRTADHEPRLLTLDQALAIAADKNYDVKKAEEYRRWLEARYVEERAAAFPHLALSASAGRYYDASQQDFYKGIPAEFQPLIAYQQDARLGQVTLNQALFTWGQVGAAIRGAKWALATGDDQLRRFQQAVRRDVTAAFYDVLLAKEFAAITSKTVEQRRRHLDETQKRYALGTATDYDVLSAEVALANARPDVISAANTVRTARERLRFLLAEEDEVDATGTLEAEVAPPPRYDDVLADAFAHRPELATSDHTRRAELEIVKINGAYDRPRLDLQGGYGVKNVEVFDQSSRGKTWNLGLVLSFPFFDGLKTRAKVAEAKSDLRTTELAEKQLRDGIALEVRLAVDQAAKSAEIVRALSTTVAQAERLLEMAEKGYEFGVKTKLEVDDAQLNLRTARGNLASAQRDVRVAQVNLAWVAGTLGEAPAGSRNTGPGSGHRDRREFSSERPIAGSSGLRVGWRGAGGESDEERVVGGGDAEREQAGGEAEAGVHERRRGERQAHEHRGGGEAGVAEHDVIGRRVAQGDQHQQDVGEDQDRVHRLEERHRIAPDRQLPNVVRPHRRETDQEQNGDGFLGGDEARALAAVRRNRDVVLHAVERRQRDEDRERPGGVGQHVRHRAPHLRPVHRLVHDGEPLERLPQQDQGEDLELLAHRVGHRLGEREHQRHRLEQQQQRERDVHREEVVGGELPAEPAGEHVVAVDFDHQQREQERRHQHAADAALGRRRVPALLDEVEEPGQQRRDPLHRTVTVNVRRL